jgi:hypothetical protein
MQRLMITFAWETSCTESRREENDTSVCFDYAALGSLCDEWARPGRVVGEVWAVVWPDPCTGSSVGE